MSDKPEKAARNLDIDRIVEAAWIFVDRDGVDAMSTRALATELGVRGPALYWHVRSKQQLFGLMIEQILIAGIIAPPSDLGWREWLQMMCRGQREALLKHRDSGRIASLAPPLERTRTDVFPLMTKPLTSAGFSSKQAVAAAGFLVSFLLGHVIYEQREKTREFLTSMVDPDEAFEFGLDVFLHGLEARLVQLLPQAGKVEGSTVTLPC